MNDKRRIGFLMGKVDGTGGIARVSSILSDALVHTGQYEIHVFSFHPSLLSSGFHWNDSIVVHDLLDVPKNMFRGLPKALKRLRSNVAQYEIEVLVICGFNVGLLGVAATRFKKTKVLYWSHSSFKGYKVPFKNFNEQMASYFADAVVTLTKADKVTYRKRTRAKKIVQIYNPVDERILRGNKTYNMDSKKVISVGRLDESKNFHSYTLDVAKKVFDRLPGHEWHIYGSGDYKDYILEEISEQKLEGKVVLKGHADDIYTLYPQYALLVMTSSFEGFPMVLLEGMANQLPMVSFDVPTGPNEIIRNNENGYLIPAFDCDQMAEKIVTLLIDHEKRYLFSKANSKLPDEFSVGQIIKKWTSLFDELQR
ncbi:glycosyltransferase [Flagellimonas lutaonensis]|uniref:Uncharacterized protein n=1 Tax=Flagellimonas lutaonensis TaxID=516051 RepID=A0A0D5YV36_9FLAO|nr:glycosyltransferase [Allomuricauda lutaonensis]AKA36085.1 hypothetical protein VC82_2513 [Allomuricauda lutaonensis]